MKTVYSEETLATLRAQLDTEEDPAKRKRLKDILSEGEGYALTGDAHGREGDDETS